ncbi:LA_1737 family protein [Leptospira soteropolitanensis]|uniref:LA_1737 family protein n=1 Tax=Leptospira soteropolitanensis TaxID=2950025 RepID=UPI003898E926
MKFYRFVLVFLFITFPLGIFPKTWPDLEAEKEIKVYGSERSAKFTASNIFYDVENWTNHYSVRAFGFYRYYDYPKAKTKSLFPFYYHIQSKSDNREYKRILNINITKERDAIDQSFYPFVFWGKDSNKSYLTTIPFFFSSSSGTNNKFGFPVIPLLYYQNRETSGENKNIYFRLLTFLHFETNENQGLHEFSLFPFVYYSKNNYLFLPILLYYQNQRSNENEYWMGPIYYANNKAKEENLFVAFPIFGRYRKPGKEIDFIFPVYLNYANEEEDYHINLLWYTKTNSANVNFAANDGNVYLDFDFGVLYNLFGYSQRTKVLSGGSLSKKTNPIELNDPKLVKKREFNRDNSDSFIGYQLLFGIFSYERADSKRHIRLLPLAWFTWDEASNDNVVLLPPFFPIWFSYQADDLEYKILFPLYGKQKDKDSEFRAYLLNVYLTEEVKENNRKESSYFWPFVNTYESDVGSGHRILPFYVHKKEIKEKYKINSTYTLFSIYQQTTGVSSTRTEFLFWPLWLSYEDRQSSQSEREHTVWITPFFYRNARESRTRTNVLWFIDWEWYQERDITFKTKTKPAIPIEQDKKLSHLLIFPFYKTNTSFSVIPLSFNDWSGEDFATFTLLNYYRWNRKGHYYNFLYLMESENTDDSYRFRSLGGLLWGFDKGKSEINRITFLWLGYDDRSYKTTINFFPILRVADADKEKSRLYGPFFYYLFDSEEEKTELLLAGLGYYHNKTKSDNQYSTYVLLGALYQEKTEIERGYIKRGSLWGWLWEYQTEDNGYEKFSILKLFSYTKEVDGTKKIMGISI